MAQLRHIALVVKDLERAAAFYQAAFGMRRSEKTESQTAFRIYLSDGVMNLALLQYKGETGSGLKDGGQFSGPHHFGFVVDDLEEAGHDIEAAGGAFFFDLGKPGDEGFERKFRDPDGTIFDINTQGWPVEFAPDSERHAAE